MGPGKEEPMTKQDLDTLNLAEHLFIRVFAQNPNEKLETLIAKCVEAAVVYDEAIGKLNGVKPKAKKAA
jgi:hypothetical protein